MNMWCVGCGRERLDLINELCPLCVVDRMREASELHGQVERLRADLALTRRERDRLAG